MFKIGDRVERKRYRFHDELPVEEVWEPATVLDIGMTGISIEYDKGSREMVERSVLRKC